MKRTPYEKGMVFKTWQPKVAEAIQRNRVAALHATRFRYGSANQMTFAAGGSTQWVLEGTLCQNGAGMDAAGMIVVELCMGSACFALGNKRTVDIVTAFVASEQLQHRVTIKGAFCEGLCGKGPVIKINGVPCFGQSAESLLEQLKLMTEKE